jgi:hypothetical protein
MLGSARSLGVVLLVALVLTTGTQNAAGASTDNRQAGSARSRRTVLKVVPGDEQAAVAAAADVVRERLTRMGVTARVSPSARRIEIVSSADEYQLHAAAQHSATTIASVTSSAVRRCGVGGTPSSGPATRCYSLGSTVTGVSGLSSAVARSGRGEGWRLEFSVERDQYPSFRSTLGAAVRASWRSSRTASCCLRSPLVSPVCAR